MHNDWSIDNRNTLQLTTPKLGCEANRIQLGLVFI